MFGLELWHIWALVALFFVILEIFTSGFAVMCFSFGAIGSAICAACGLSMLWQLIVFAVVTALAFVFVRPLVIKMFFKGNEVKTNADAIIGRKARVSERIDNAANTGRVAIDGDDWKAVSADGQTIEIGETVEIISRDSIILTVKKIINT